MSLQSRHLQSTVNIDFDVDEILSLVGENCEPEQVFNEDQLIAWAEANGYVKAENEA